SQAEEPPGTGRHIRRGTGVVLETGNDPFERPKLEPEVGLEPRGLHKIRSPLSPWARRSRLLLFGLRGEDRLTEETAKPPRSSARAARGGPDLRQRGR